MARDGGTDGRRGIAGAASARQERLACFLSGLDLGPQSNGEPNLTSRELLMAVYRASGAGPTSRTAPQPGPTA